MSAEEKTHEILVSYDSHGSWWVRCSCNAQWRIPKMATRDDMVKEVEETTIKHRAYAKRMETRPD